MAVMEQQHSKQGKEPIPAGWQSVLWWMALLLGLSALFGLHAMLTV